MHDDWAQNLRSQSSHEAKNLYIACWWCACGAQVVQVQMQVQVRSQVLRCCSKSTLT